MDLIFDLISVVSAHRPEHSLFIGGQQLPLEARVGGIFSGLVVGLAYCLLLGRARALWYPGGMPALTLLGFIGLMGLDGLNAVLFDLGQPHLYTPSNPVRLGTGLLCGLALAAFVLPSVAAVLWKDGELEAPLKTMGELLGAIGVLTLAWLLAIADLAYLYYPVALLYVGGVVLSFSLANLYFLGLKLQWMATSWREAARPLAVGCGMAMLELLILRLVRGA